MLRVNIRTTTGHILITVHNIAGALLEMSGFFLCPLFCCVRTCRLSPYLPPICSQAWNFPCPRWNSYACAGADGVGMQSAEYLQCYRRVASRCTQAAPASPSPVVVVITTSGAVEWISSSPHLCVCVYFCVYVCAYQPSNWYTSRSHFYMVFVYARIDILGMRVLTTLPAQVRLTSAHKRIRQEQQKLAHNNNNRCDSHTMLSVIAISDEYFWSVHV